MKPDQYAETCGCGGEVWAGRCQNDDCHYHDFLAAVRGEVRRLEARIARLKRMANAYAAEKGLAAPYPDAGGAS